MNGKRGHVSSKHVCVKEVHEDAFDFVRNVGREKGGQQDIAYTNNADAKECV